MTENRDTLKGHFTKNAIPTEGHFAALIDGQLNQAEDGIFKDPNEPLSLRPSGALPVLRLHPSNSIPATGHFSLQLLAPLVGTKPNLNIVDNDSNTHLFFEAHNRYVGLGTTAPTVKLDVAGKVNASGGVEAATGFSVPKAAIGYAWSSLAGATAELSVSGAVGVGTTVPAAGVKLDVVGKVKTSGGVEASTGISATKAVVGYGWSSVSTATADLSVAGSVGLGTISPAAGAKLDVVGKVVASGGIEAGTGISTNKVVVGWTWSAVASATADLSVLGAVGVGTFAPAAGAKLDVVGKVNASGGVEAGTAFSVPKAGVGYSWSQVASATADLCVASSMTIGKTAPTAGIALDVLGKIYATGGLELGNSFSAPKAVVGYSWSALAAATADLSVNGSLGVGLTQPGVGIKVDVNGKTRSTDLTVTNYAYVATNLSVGQDGVVPGAKLYVNGKTNTAGLDCYGNTYVTTRLSVGIDPTDASVTQALHIAGGAEFRQSGANTLYLKSDTGDVNLRMLPADGRTPWIRMFTNAATTAGIYLQAQPGTVNGVSGSILNVGHIDGNPCKLLVDGEVEGSWIRGGLGTFTSTLTANVLSATTNVSGSKIYIGTNWNLSVNGNTLILSHGSTKYAAFSFGAGVHRFNVQGSTNYFYVSETGTTGTAAGTGPLLV